MVLQMVGDTGAADLTTAIRASCAGLAHAPQGVLLIVCDYTRHGVCSDLVYYAGVRQPRDRYRNKRMPDGCWRLERADAPAAAAWVLIPAPPTFADPIRYTTYGYPQHIDCGLAFGCQTPFARLQPDANEWVACSGTGTSHDDGCGCPHHEVVAYDFRVFILGEHSAHDLVYHMDSNKWFDLSRAVGEFRRSPVACATGGRVYALARNVARDAGTSKCDALDISLADSGPSSKDVYATRQWLSIAPMPAAPRAGRRAVAVSDRIFVFDVGCIRQYCVRTDAWSELDWRMPCDLQWFSSHLTPGGQIVLAGGWSTSQTEPLVGAWVGDPERRMWTRLPDIPPHLPPAATSADHDAAPVSAPPVPS